LWQQIQADVYGMAVDLAAAEEGAAYGAALLAGVGAGMWQSVKAACETAVHVARQVEPIRKNVDLMNRRYEEYRKLYPALRGIGHRN
jgi:xylulokinase